MTSNQFQRLIANKEFFSLDDGKLKIMGIYGRINTILTTVIRDAFLEENIGEKKTADILYLLGESQSFHAIKMLVNKRGMQRKGNEIKIIKETLGQSEFIGFGQGKIINVDLDKKQATISVENSSYLEISNKLFQNDNKRTDHFTRGIIGGIFKYIFEEEVITKCQRTNIPTKTICKIITKKEFEENKEELKEWEICTPKSEISKKTLDLFSLKNFLK